MKVCKRKTKLYKIIHHYISSNNTNKEQLNYNYESMRQRTVEQIHTTAC